MASINLHAYVSVSDAKQQLANDFLLFNTRRPHSSLSGHTPDMTCFKKQPIEQAA